MRGREGKEFGKIWSGMGLNIVNVQAYADDLVLISSTGSGLQILIGKVAFLIYELGFRINLDRTVLMF
jgi:hypothetical protein